MSLTGRIAELKNRHERLEEKLQEQYKRPAADNIELQDLKRQKLRIKEELQELRASF